MVASVAVGSACLGCGLSEVLHYFLARWREARQHSEQEFRASIAQPLNEGYSSSHGGRSTSLEGTVQAAKPRRRWQSILVADVVRPSPSQGLSRMWVDISDMDAPIRSVSQDALTNHFWNIHADPQAVARENVIVPMVGLPARGKSYISGAIIRHLHLLGVRAKSFNAGALRRQEGKAGISADFFAAGNKDGKETRERLAMECCDNLLEWLAEASEESCSSLAILDATNTTVERRQAVVQRCTSWMQKRIMKDPVAVPLRIVFLESICDDTDILEDNYEMKKLNDDYKDQADATAGLEDFKKRVQAYEAQYVPLDDGELERADADGDAFSQVPVGSVRVINGGAKLHCCHTGHSLVAAPVIQLLHAMHLTRRRIVLVPEDEATPQLVAAFMLKVEGEEGGRPMDVICSASDQALFIAEQLETIDRHADCLHQMQPRAVLTLSELTSTSRDRRSSAEYDPQSPLPGSARRRGERFADVVRRMREVILLIERLPRSVLIVCQRGDPWKVLLAHFRGCPHEVAPSDLSLPQGPIVELRRDHKGYAMVECPWPEVDASPS
mmetsp:Transcript_34698/g.81009  ORF Transcript_34698/g.81009 Transcript_34698/m.81009 type:complete len:556 (-) Transcript_34698:102-1769(-)